jgi:hypothetical protein
MPSSNPFERVSLIGVSGFIDTARAAVGADSPTMVVRHPSHRSLHVLTLVQLRYGNNVQLCLLEHPPNQ